MLLEELLELFNENSNVEVYDSNELMLLGRYDGKNDIPEEYNEYEVTDIFGSQNANTIAVEINYERRQRK